MLVSEGEKQMKRKHYNAEYKQQAAYRVSLGQESIPAIARDLGISVTSLRDWIAQVEKRVNPFPGSGNVILTPDEAMLRKLERENRELREEIEILKKAAAYFAKNLR